MALSPEGYKRFGKAVDRDDVVYIKIGSEGQMHPVSRCEVVDGRLILSAIPSPVVNIMSEGNREARDIAQRIKNLNWEIKGALANGEMLKVIRLQRRLGAIQEKREAIDGA